MCLKKKTSPCGIQHHFHAVLCPCLLLMPETMCMICFYLFKGQQMNFLGFFYCCYLEYIIHLWTRMILSFQCHQNFSYTVDFTSLTPKLSRYSGVTLEHGQFCQNTHNQSLKQKYFFTKFSQPAALQVVKMTTSSASSDENFMKMTFPFQKRLRHPFTCPLNVASFLGNSLLPLWSRYKQCRVISGRFMWISYGIK